MDKYCKAVTFSTGDESIMETRTFKEQSPELLGVLRLKQI